jgi:hypothetical protein
MAIELTKEINYLLSNLSVNQQDHVLKWAWNACCDGESISARFHKDFDYDIWDGEHEDFRQEVEETIVQDIVEDLVDPDHKIRKNWDAIVNLMDDDIREAVHSQHIAAISDRLGTRKIAFYNAYCAQAPGFAEIIEKEFGVQA